MIEAPPAERKSSRQKVLLVLVGLLAGYALAELLANVYDLAFPPEHKFYWVYEDASRTVQFDPILGYRLTKVPSRVAAISRGRVDFLGLLRGNSHGFESRFDFGPERDSPGAQRIAILGDSFSNGAEMDWNWPDRVQQAAIERHEPIELLNISMGGWGLANWSNAVTRFLEPQNYQLDGLVFAVWHSDLVRPFRFSDYTGLDRVAGGHALSWDPATYPRTAEEARPLQVLSDFAYIVSREQFDQALRGEWTPPAHRRFRLYLASAVTARLERWLRQRRNSMPSPGPVGFDPGREKAIRDIRRYVDERHIPVMVVYVPSIDVLLGERRAGRPFEETKLFAEELGGVFVDGSQAFANMTPAQLQENWRTFDYHWNQAGSDHFAEFMHKILTDWLASRADRASDSRTSLPQR